MKNMKFLFWICTFLIFYSCDKDDMDVPEPEPGNAIQLSDHATLGSILTDEAGMTLYYFSRDYQNTSNCEGGCLGAWPVFYTDVLTLDEGLEEDDFASITRSDGTMQTTYKGWPLYYFTNDAAAGDVNGDGANDIWFVAKPDYTIMYVHAQLTGADGKNYIINDSGEFVEGDGRTFYLTDESGNTLYGFAPDKFNQNNFTKEDFSNNSVWPIYETELNALPSVLTKDNFDVIDIFGHNQLSFKGWPLYYFGNDMVKGDNKGVSVPRPGVWPVVNTSSPVAPQ